MSIAYEAFDGAEFTTEKEMLDYEGEKYAEICGFLDYNLKPTTFIGDTFVVRIPENWSSEQIQKLDQYWHKRTNPLCDSVVTIKGVVKPGLWIHIGDNWFIIDDVLGAFSAKS